MTTRNAHNSQDRNRGLAGVRLAPWSGARFTRQT
jgi:hypothetical protein